MEMANTAKIIEITMVEGFDLILRVEISKETKSDKNEQRKDAENSKAKMKAGLKTENIETHRVRIFPEECRKEA